MVSTETSLLSNLNILYYRILCFVLEKYVKQLSNTERTELIDLLEEFSDDMEPLSNENKNEEEVVQLIRPLPIIR